ncbi:MAG: NAD-dependent protein deacetylase [Actinomycetota bacterium]|nr:NAD-dependent protein deacetylase [Actinomycetota bacterium]
MVTQARVAGPSTVQDAVDALAGRCTVLLSGAGISTDSGIPDYRGPGSRRGTPMTYAEFVSGPPAQQRYWARSYVGWRTLGRAVPNAGHRAIVALQRCGAVGAVVTQNVDGLHTAAGGRDVVDLHGRIADVVCLGCRHRSSRVELQARLDALNPGFGSAGNVVAAPDGDADVDTPGDFRVAACLRCGGVLKPDVVFFGENVPKDRVERCYAVVDAAEAMLVVGSSLTVLSGFRFVRQAHRRGLPVVIVNRGATRGDPLATVKLDAGCSPVLSVLAAALR